MGKDQEVASVEKATPARRTFSDEEKLRIVQETFAPGASVSVISRRYDVNANLIFRWRRRFEWHATAGPDASFLPVTVAEAKPLLSQPKSRIPAGGAIEVEFRSGHRVRIPAGADPVLIECVLRSLSS